VEEETNGAVAQNKTHSWNHHPVSVTGGVFLFSELNSHLL